MTKAARKIIPFGAVNTYTAHVREYPPGILTSSIIDVRGLTQTFKHHLSRNTRDFLSLAKNQDCETVFSKQWRL